MLRNFANAARKKKNRFSIILKRNHTSSIALYDKVKNKFTGNPFFTTLKTYTVYGYCISEKGASIGMRYIAVPGKYLSCIPLEPNQKAWATK